MKTKRDEALAQGVPEADVARMCWVCGQYGEARSKVPSPNGNGFITGYVCGTVGCRNHNTGWAVQTTKAGTLANRMGQRAMADTEFTKESADYLNRVGSSALDRIKHDAEESIKERD